MNNHIKKKNCVAHVRVSSTKQSQTGESMDVQENICMSIINGKEWNLFHPIWRESFSGRKDVRPIFEEILDFIKSHPGLVDYYVFRAIDRFTRGGSYTYEGMKRELAKLGVEMIDSYGIIQPSQNTLKELGFEYEWSKYSPSEITELVLANNAKSEVTNILTRTIGQEIRLTQQGFKVRSARDGYVNKEVVIEGKKKVIQVPDPERAKYFIEMFSLRAAGDVSDEEIVKRINALGYKSKSRLRWDRAHEKIIGSSGEVPLSVKQLQATIKSPIYCGIVCEKWTRYQAVKAQYDGLVSIKKFNEANRGKVFIKEDAGAYQILYNSHPEKIISRKSRNNPLFPYKNVVMCPFCAKPKTFMGSSPIGKSGNPFPTYHCSRKTHKYFGIPKKTFEENVEKYIKSLKFKQEYKDELEATFLNKYREREQEIVKASSDIHLSISELKAEQATKLKAYVEANSKVIKEKLEKEIDDLEVRINDSNGESNKIQITEDDIKSFVRETKYVMEHLEELLLDPENPRSLESMFGLVFKEFPTYHQILNGTPKLSLAFELSSEFRPAQSELGCHQDTTELESGTILFHIYDNWWLN